MLLPFFFFFFFSAPIDLVKLILVPEERAPLSLMFFPLTCDHVHCCLCFTWLNNLVQKKIVIVMAGLKPRLKLAYCLENRGIPERFPARAPWHVHSVSSGPEFGSLGRALWLT